MNNHTSNPDFSGIYAIDFEFSAPGGERPMVVCLVVGNLLTRERWHYSQADLQTMRQPPFPVHESVLVIAYYASAEMNCFLSLGWQLPINLLDLFTEFRCLTNGLPPAPGGSGLLGALNWYGLPAMDALEKKAMRELAMTGGPYTPEEMDALLDYCAEDVIALERLFPRMQPNIDWGRALLRGRYMKAATRMEFNGTPIDTQALSELNRYWSDIQDELIAEIDREYGLYDGRTFKMQRFAQYLGRHNIAWPLTPTGRLDLSEETFKDMARSYPQLMPLHELRTTLSKLRLSSLAVGKDGRNRCLLSAFRARTGRNQPSNAKFIFGPASWYRSLIRPRPGWGLAYIDWGQQEFGIAAALSGDKNMLAAYQSGDPYLSFAKQAGVVPENATKQSHPKERSQFKECALAVQYGMGEESLSLRIGQPVIQARALLRLHRKIYPVFWAWSDACLDYAMLYGKLWTVFGWEIHVGPNPNPRSLANFPMQANGAEMLRLACCMATEQEIRVCAPVHDALLIEAPLDHLEKAIKETQAILSEASAIVLNGFRLTTDVDVIRYPDRYVDERGVRMWETVWTLIDRIKHRESEYPRPEQGVTPVHTGSG
jgi:hypothetical protein